MSEEKRFTTDGSYVDAASAPPHAPKPIDPNTGQHGAYYVLSPEERAKGFVRPVRCSYIHEKCGGLTTMRRELAETYAAQPEYYGGTFCGFCRAHFPVGPAGEFLWAGTQERVGT